MRANMWKATRWIALIGACAACGDDSEQAMMSVTTAGSPAAGTTAPAAAGTGDMTTAGTTANVAAGRTGTPNGIAGTSAAASGAGGAMMPAAGSGAAGTGMTATTAGRNAPMIAGRGAAGSAGASTAGSAGSGAVGMAGGSAAGMAGGSAAGSGGQGGAPGEATFTAVYAIFMTNCAGSTCHLSRAAGGLSMTDKMTAYTNLVGVDSSSCRGEKRVVAGDPDKSELFHTLDRTQIGMCSRTPRMPEGKAKLAQADIDVIKAWIQAGAMND